MISIRRSLCVLALAFGFVASATADPVFKVTAPANATLGSTFAVDVFATDLADLYAFQFDLLFDPALLQFLGATEGAFLASGGETTFFDGGINNGLGAIEFVFDTIIGPGPGVSGSGALAHFNFLAIGSGTSLLSLANVLALDTQFNLIDVGLEGGQVQVAASSTVPEPGTLALLALGLAGLGFSRRRK